MLFDENKDSVENIYKKMIDNLPEDLLADKYYQYFYNLLETSNVYCDFINTKMIKTVDEEWVKRIESTIASIQKVVANPRRFIEEDRDVVNVALARNITPDSIVHLMSHSYMIDKINDDGTVIPNRILNVFKEESYNTYENRFICTLIIELQRFINKRFNVIFEKSKDETGTVFEMETLVDNYTETINYKLEIKIREKQTDVDNEDENAVIFTRISKIHRDINDLAMSGFMTIMKKFPPVRHPIVKTNAIGKNLDYKACYDLWNYIHGYDRVGYKIEMVKQEPVVSREMERDLYNMLLRDYFLLQNYVAETDHLNIDRPKREKEITVKYIRQVLDEIIHGLDDMPDANLRRLIMNELSDLQLKRKAERMGAHVVERKKRAADRRKKKQEKRNRESAGE